MIPPSEELNLTNKQRELVAVAETGISFFADVIGHSGEFQCVPSATTTPVAAFTSFARATSKARKATLLLFSVAVLLAGGAAAVRGQSARDGFDPNANGGVRVVVVQPDGKILIGGEFTTLSPNGGGPVTRNYIARLNPDGTLDLAFNPNANGPVESIAVQADGKILAGGIFATIGGQTRNHIARLEATTGLADSFNPNASNEVRSIVVQADGKILVGGTFTTIGGATRNRIARLDATTGLADSFDPNANSYVEAIVVQGDGRILVGGDFNGTNSIGGQTRNRIARLDGTTGLADSFDPNANSVVYAIAVQADGKILAGGSFNGTNSIGGQLRRHIGRLNATSGLADSFDPNANDSVFAIAVQADGRILAGGQFTDIGGQFRNRIARIDATTGLAGSFDPNANNPVFAIAVQADGKILVGGNFTTLAPEREAPMTRNRIARLEADGRRDQTLNANNGISASTFVDATAVQPDGKILIGGLFSSVSGVTRNNIARLNTDGTLDAAFDPNADASVETIAVQADGKILAGGYFSSIGGQMRRHIARLDPTTGLADSFDPDANAIVYALAVQADGKILVGGAFSTNWGPITIGGQTRNYIARLDPTTGLADSFNPDASDGLLSITVQADARILTGGFFNIIGGQARNYIARLDPTTGLADSFNPNAAPTFNNRVYAIAVQEDGKVVAGGDFTNMGPPRNYIARLDAMTGLADSWNPNANGSVLSIAVQADGKVAVGGQFDSHSPSSIGGQTRNHIARLDGTTGLADSFDPNADGIIGVSGITLQADGKLLVGGDFSNIGGQTRRLFARLSNDTAALQNLAVTQGTIAWTHGGSSPQFTRVTFEYSTDHVNYTPVGNGTFSGGNWTLTGLNFPTGQNFYIRARGYYRSGLQNASESISESVRNAFVAGPTTLGNISTRLRVETGDNALIGGFIVAGAQPKRIIVRAIGPSLPLTGALANPILELHGPGNFATITNDNWRSDQEAEIIATTLAPSNDLESAIVVTLPANNSAYTAIVRGVNSGTGIGLVEAYDLDRTVDSKLANISTRGLVQTGDNVLIGGLIVLGQSPLRVIVRAIGPSLPVPGALGDPTLSLHDTNGVLIAFNDNWRSDQEADIIATGLPPSNNLESAIVRNLAPGNYTAIVRGKNDAVGLGLVEVYHLQ